MTDAPRPSWQIACLAVGWTDADLAPLRAFVAPLGRIRSLNVSRERMDFADRDGVVWAWRRGHGLDTGGQPRI